MSVWILTLNGVVDTDDDDDTDDDNVDAEEKEQEEIQNPSSAPRVVLKMLMVVELLGTEGLSSSYF